MNETVINRVPHIIFLYWVIKIASSTLGETGADMFSMTLNLGYGTTILIFMAVFAVLLAIKLRLKCYNPLAYWLVFTATAIVGTGVSDFIDRTLGLGYPLGSAVLVLMLLGVLALWYTKEKSISVENVSTNTAEIYYWTAFLIANTLGTAAGDFMADTLGLGFMMSALIITVLLGITAVLHLYSKVSGILLFWIAFVLTRPFGATFGDLLTKPIEKGGLNLGTIGASVFFTVALVLALVKETQLETSRGAVRRLVSGPVDQAAF